MRPAELPQAEPAPAPVGAWRRARPLLGAAATVAYALWCIGVLWLAPRSPLAVATFLAPCYGFVCTWLWRRGSRVLAIISALGLPLLLFFLYQRYAHRAELFYVGEYALIYLSLAAWFSASLRGTALITHVARRVHPLTPDMAAYTVKLTRAWAIYFLVMALLSLAVFGLLGLSAWATFTLVLSPVSMLVFFVGEHFLRYHWHPEFERASIAQAVKSWRTGTTP